MRIHTTLWDIFRSSLVHASRQRWRGFHSPDGSLLWEIGQGRRCCSDPDHRANGGDDRTRRGQTLRLEREAWRQRKMLAIEQDTASHDLLIQAVNLLFDHYNRPAIAG